MYELTNDFMDLEQIARSGQCFRWKKITDNTYSVVAYGRYLKITQDGNKFRFSCDEDEFKNIWYDYFDMDTDYARIGKLITESDDEYLKEAYSASKGVRILKQDIWEMIVTFLISQNNNIPRITGSVEKICERIGEHREVEDVFYYAFPSADDATNEFWDDKTLGLGYRNTYLAEMFEYVRNNPHYVDELKQMSFDEAFKSLMQHKGIGAKVANCICLFGLHHINAFPIDTHVKQILEEHYQDGFDFERYDGVAGVIQQYLFYYELVKDKVRMK